MLKDRLGEILRGSDSLEASLERLQGFDDIFFSEQFLEPRALLAALRHEHGGVLLIDEIDKADEEFEAFLLEVLADFQVTIPEIGTIRANVKPLVILTSNNTREMSDALKRRCLHLHIPFPDRKLEASIVAARLPNVSDTLNQQLVDFVQGLRELDLRKHPSVAETIDWARTLLLMHADELGADIVRDTLNVLLKYEDDIGTAEKDLSKLLAAARGAIDTPAGVNSTLARFLEALRHADLQISPAEAIDAYRTMSAVGPNDRWFLRDAFNDIAWEKLRRSAPRGGDFRQVLHATT